MAASDGRTRGRACLETEGPAIEGSLCCPAMRLGAAVTVVTKVSEEMMGFERMTRTKRYEKRKRMVSLG